MNTFSVWVSGLLLAALPFICAAEVLPAEQAFQAHAQRIDGNTVRVQWSMQEGYYLYRDSLKVAVDGHPLAVDLPQGQTKDDPNFGSVEVYHTPVEASARSTSNTLQISYQGCAEAGVCYPPQHTTVVLNREHSSGAPLHSTQPPADPIEQAKESSPVSNTNTSNSIGLLAAVGLALLGGLVLNLMPCVLPVLSLKAMGMAHTGARARSHALWYTLGVVLAFALLGACVVLLKTLGIAAGWGFQLQHPIFVALLCYLMVVLGLGMSGVLTLGGSVGSLAQLEQRGGAIGDFFSGVLACVVASPCVAPFMGSALAFALTAPLWAAMAVFVALGVGLALPFLLIGLVPRFANALPKPGAWMERMKQWLAVPMYLTGAWLAWIVGQQRGTLALVVVLLGAGVLGAGALLFERNRWQGIARMRRIGVALCGTALVPVLALGAIQAPERVSQAIAFDPVALERLRGEGRTVLVNITADWCITCKANEQTVFNREEFSHTLADNNVVYMVGDWTNPDPTVSAFLSQQHAVGVPLYQVYHGQSVQQLPNILTPHILEQALHR